jgi:hypothetical protein
VPGNDPEAGNISQPLQLRRGSTSQKRKEILDKYKTDLNETTGQAYYNAPRVAAPIDGGSSEALL